MLHLSIPHFENHCTNKTETEFFSLKIPERSKQLLFNLKELLRTFMFLNTTPSV